MSQQYEKTIGLKALYLTFIRRFIAIFAIFVPIVLASFIVTSCLIVKTYQSSIVLLKSSGINQTQYSVMSQITQKSSTTDKVAQRLTVVHSNGSSISSGEICSGISFGPYVSNGPSFTIIFQSNDPTIVKPVLNELAAVSVETLKELENDYATLSVSAPASEPVKNSKENQYFLIGMAAGAVLALGMTFIYEIVADEVYDKDDLDKLGIPAFEIKASKKA